MKRRTPISTRTTTRDPNTALCRSRETSARAEIEDGDIFVATTVLLESEWVLRSGYGCAPAQVADGLSGLAGLPGVTGEEPGLLARAIEWLRDGEDFADSPHLANAG